MAESLIRFEHVTLGYGRRTVLSGVSLEVGKGDFLGIVGPNGAGKTTLVRALLGTLRPRSGNICFAGGKRPRFGYVPQREGLDLIYPLTAAEVVVMGRYDRVGLLRHAGSADRQAARQALAHVDLESLADVPYRDLSGGQKQRALIARALVGDPDVLVLDEPTNGMDFRSQEQTLALVDQLHAEGLTVIMISHLLNEVAAHARTLAIVEERFFRVGPLQDVLTSENLSRLYDLPVAVRQVDGVTVILPVRGASPAGPA